MALFQLCKRSFLPVSGTFSPQNSFVQLSRQVQTTTQFWQISSKTSPAANRSEDFPVDDETSDKSSPMPTGAANVIDVSDLDRVEKSINRVSLMGRVGNDPQLRGTEKNPVLLFSLATHENFRNETGRLQQKTMWHRIGIFKPGLREAVFKYLKKGQRLYVTGNITYSNLKDPATNTARVATTIVADDVIVLSGPSM